MEYAKLREEYIIITSRLKGARAVKADAEEHYKACIKECEDLTKEFDEKTCEIETWEAIETRDERYKALSEREKIQNDTYNFLINATCGDVLEIIKSYNPAEHYIKAFYDSEDKYGKHHFYTHDPETIKYLSDIHTAHQTPEDTNKGAVYARGSYARFRTAVNRSMIGIQSEAPCLMILKAERYYFRGNSGYSLKALGFASERLKKILPAEEH